MSKDFQPAYSFTHVLPHLAAELSCGHQVAMELAYFKLAAGNEQSAIEALATSLSEKLSASWSYVGKGRAIAFMRQGEEVR